MPPLETDLIFGPSYLAHAAFTARARFFGAGMSVQGLTEDELKALLASASRAIDAKCGRAFTPDALTEQHRWDSRSRRVRPNAPPVVSLTSFKIQTSPTTAATFPVGAVYYNEQENYLELAALEVGQTLTQPLITLGFTTPVVEIVYTSFQEVPREIVMATGYMAAHIANGGFVDSLVPPQFGTLNVGGSKLSNQRVSEPPIINELCADFIRIPVA